MRESTERVLERIEKYRSFMRFKYSTQEKLYRQTVLRDYYKILNKQATPEKLSVRIESAEHLSAGKFTMPLKVRGVFLKEGRPKKKYYKLEELKAAVTNPINSKFPLMLDHKDTEAGKIIGMVDKIEFDEVEGVIRWWGHINDETFARNVEDKAITDVSATIYSITDYDPKVGLIGTDLTFKELSLVMEGSVKGNYIESYK